MTSDIGGILKCELGDNSVLAALTKLKKPKQNLVPFRLQLAVATIKFPALLIEMDLLRRVGDAFWDNDPAVPAVRSARSTEPSARSATPM
jgi:hypothetical protein